jgi:hypothetical protein
MAQATGASLTEWVLCKRARGEWVMANAFMIVWCFIERGKMNDFSRDRTLVERLFKPLWWSS